MTGSRDQICILWCFVAPQQLLAVEKLGARYRSLGLLIPPEDDLPVWAREFPGGVFTLGMRSGDYDGPVGVYANRFEPDLPVLRARIDASYRKKHPHWSNSKIARAVDAAMSKHEKASSPSQLPVNETERQADDVLAFLREACVDGPITFVLADYGLINCEENGSDSDITRSNDTKWVSNFVQYRVDHVGRTDLLNIACWQPIAFE